MNDLLLKNKIRQFKLAHTPEEIEKGFLDRSLDNELGSIGEETTNNTHLEPHIYTWMGYEKVMGLRDTGADLDAAVEGFDLTI